MPGSVTETMTEEPSLLQFSSDKSQRLSESQSERPLLSFAPPPTIEHEERRHPPVREPTLNPDVGYIPSDHRHRTLVVCFDGTGDQFDADNSNIVQLVSLLKRNDRSKQMVYYQAGIGTYISPQIATPFVAKVSKILDEMLAWNIDAHIMGGYEFLMQNYLAGDRICIFGFSRGAYTARCLAGMIHKVGLLPADNFQQVPFAYKMYKRADHVGWEQSNEFKRAFSVDVDIEFVGVWDTVSSVGLIPKRLPFSTSNAIVRTFRHAISLDERRAKFKANLWNRPTQEESQLGFSRELRAFQAKQKSHMEHTHPTSSSKNADHGRKEMESTVAEERMLNSLEREFSVDSGFRTDVEEVWFSGCHCDVGGGSVSNHTRNSLARIPLRWMIRECFKADTGIMFSAEGLRSIGLDPASLYPFVTPRPPMLSLNGACITKPPKEEIPTNLHKRSLWKRKRPEMSHVCGAVTTGSLTRVGTEEEEELKDALSPAYDQLTIGRHWWLLELLPLPLRYQKGDDQWVSQYTPNMANPRIIPRQKKHGVRIHRSVKLRMEAEYEKSKGKKYAPKPQLKVAPTWVD